MFRLCIIIPPGAFHSENKIEFFDNENDDESVSDVWIEDCSIAAILLQMTALSLGLGSCWVQIRLRPHEESRTAEQFVRELLGIPGNLRVECVIAVGYAAEEKEAVEYKSLPWEKIHDNFWSSTSDDF